MTVAGSTAENKEHNNKKTLVQRRRVGGKSTSNNKSPTLDDEQLKQPDDYGSHHQQKKNDKAPTDGAAPTPQKKKVIELLTFVTTKWAILRLLAFVYWVAFTAAWNQNRGLMGEHGLQPAIEYWPRLQDHVYASSSSDASKWQGFLQYPSLFWWIPLSDSTLDGVAAVGMIIAGLATTGIYVSWLSFAVLWLLQFSLVTVSAHTPFYQYGWESQLLETGVLAMFLCDLPCLQKNERWNLNLALRSQQHFTSPSQNIIILWLFRWLCFRISMGAGLIKVRGSSCWTDKTCLWYHFETQPIPSPLSFVFHFLSKETLSQAVDLDLFVQLYTSWMVLLPYGVFGRTTTLLNRIVVTMVRVAGLVQAGFMINIMLSGNFSFLNHLTIVPALACLDDACWPTWLASWIVPGSRAMGHHHHRHSKNTTKSTPPSDTSTTTTTIPPRKLVDMSFFCLVAFLSWPVIANLLQLNNGGGRQIMNGSFDNFRLVNTYGAFGDVGRQRFEAIISVSPDGETWYELDLPCKPAGNPDTSDGSSITRRPCFCAPYHYRLDWNIWFLGFPPHSPMLERRERWMYRLLEVILDPTHQQQSHPPDQEAVVRPWLKLLHPSSAQYLRETKVVYAKVDMYHYQMAASLGDILAEYWRQYFIETDASSVRVVWWNRTYSEPLIPTVGWDSEKKKMVRAKNIIPQKIGR